MHRTNDDHWASNPADAMLGTEQDEVADLVDEIDRLLQTAESGADWAEIARLESILKEAEST
jgi:hypothetical protein